MLRNTKSKYLWNVVLYLLSALHSERDINKTNLLDAISYPKIKSLRGRKFFSSVIFKCLLFSQFTAQRNNTYMLVHILRTFQMPSHLLSH